MAVQYVKYRVQFKDVNETEYKVEIYDSVPTFQDVPQTIQLLAGDNPLSIDEDDSKDFFEPIRTQTGNLSVCTKIMPQTAMPNGGYLNIADIMPDNNTQHPVVVSRWDEDKFGYILEWCGYLSCESYTQDYTGIPETLELSIISVLEAWKSIYYSSNAKIVRVGELIAELMFGTYYFQQLLHANVPVDGSDLWTSLINTSIFVEKEDYQDEESTLYKVEGKSYYDILETICKFMGWTAREQANEIYIQQLQGYGLLENTETRNMSALDWRGANHKRDIIQGEKSVKVTANLADLDVKIEIPDTPYSELEESFRQIGDPLTSTYMPWVYMLASADDDAYSNLILHQYAGDILMGRNFQYSFTRVNQSVDILEVIQNSIPYLNNLSQAYEAYREWNDPTRIYAGAFLCKMQIDEPTDPDLQHQSTKDGLFVSLFPGAWQEHTDYGYPIVEMRSVQAFAANEDGYFNLDATLKIFYDMLAIGGRDQQCRLMLALQVGDKVWNGSKWINKSQNMQHFFPAYNTEGTGFEKNWNSGMDIDEVSGICIPTFYTDPNYGTKKHVMGEVVLQIYPETRFFTKITTDETTWRWLIFGIFFEKFNLSYIPTRSVKRTDRSENVYYQDLKTAFPEDASIDTDIASWLHNNPSPSLLYKADGSEPLQSLTYKNANLVDVQSRPEKFLLNRMAQYYRKPRTILSLEVKHIGDKPLPLLRYNGLGDDKLYAPMSESRDFYEDTSTINFMEIPQ